MAEKKSMADVWKAMQKIHGEEGLFSGNSDLLAIKDVISTGSFAVDDALDIGGIPKGDIIQYAGFESSGKTMLSLATIAECQKKDPKSWALFIDCEYTLDKNWVKNLGVDLDRLFVYKENNGVKIFERLVGQPSKTSGKKSKLGILDLEIENGGSGLNLIVIDSIAAMQPPVEELANIETQTMAAMARFLPSQLRRLTPLLSATGVSLICINQLRERPGVVWGDPTLSSGGHALKYACSAMIHLNKLNGADSKIEKNGELIGSKVRCRIDKNKLGKPYRTADFSIEFTKGIINKHEELRDLGVKYGLIKRPNNRTYEFEGVKYNGKEEIANLFLEEEKQKEMWGKIVEAKKNFILTETVENIEENENSEDND